MTDDTETATDIFRDHLEREQNYVRQIYELRAEVERLRDLLAFNGINPDGKVESAKGARFAYDPAWLKAHQR